MTRRSPKQNRVDPFGQLHAVEARGMWMGNRGVLHNETGKVVAQWRLRRWIICKLSFKNRWRPVFAPRRYSELFFLDEATAFAAGHRPCAECRRERYNEFRAAWTAANSVGHDFLHAEEIDDQLHDERVLPNGKKRSYESTLLDLPSGAFIERAGVAHLVWNGGLIPWTFAGYLAPVTKVSVNDYVRVLTPASIVATFNEGFIPEVHDSVGHVR